MVTPEVDKAPRQVNAADPWRWIRDCVWTVDEVDKVSPIKRFPVAACPACRRYAGGDESRGILEAGLRVRVRSDSAAGALPDREGGASMTLTREELKARALAAIDQRKAWLVSIARTILESPEAGFQEFKTSRLVAQKLEELRIPHDSGIALTGIKGRLAGAVPGPTVAVIGEPEALRVPDHPKADRETGAAHACGHDGQIGMMLGVAVGLVASRAMQALAGRVCLIAVPADDRHGGPLPPHAGGAPLRGRSRRNRPRQRLPHR